MWGPRVSIEQRKVPSAVELQLCLNFGLLLYAYTWRHLQDKPAPAYKVMVALRPGTLQI